MALSPPRQALPVKRETASLLVLGDVFSVPASAVNSRVALGPCLSLPKPRLLIFVHEGTAFMSPDTNMSWKIRTVWGAGMVTKGFKKVVIFKKSLKGSVNLD